MSRFIVPAKRLSAIAALAGLTVLSLPTTAAAEAHIPTVRQRSTAVATIDVLPTVQINGVVWTQLVVGNTVYAGGQFTTARPAGAAPGTQEIARSNLLAYNLKTGKLITSFAPKINGPVRALAVSKSKKTLYVGGGFDKVGAVARGGAAAFSVATGALKSFNPKVDGTVNAIAVSKSSVYLGGAFTFVDKQARGRLVAVTLVSGKRRAAWRPTADREVTALVLARSDSKLVVGGRFSTLNDKKATGLGAVSIKTGKTVTFKANTVVKNSGSNASITSLKRVGNTIYGTGYTYGAGNFEGTFSASATNGALNWIADCHGDTYDSFTVGKTVYTVGHAHYCANIGGFPDTNPRVAWYRALAFTTTREGEVAENGQPTYTINGVTKAYGNFGGQPSPAMINWFPEITDGTFTGQNQGAWSITGTKSYVLLGGEFPAINGVPQQGLARMAIPSKSPHAEGPNPSSTLTPTLAPQADGVKLTWRTSRDLDDLKLYYSVVRNGQVVYTKTKSSTFWNRPSLSWVDTTVPSGQTVRYQVVVRDRDGNSTSSNIASINTP